MSAWLGYTVDQPDFRAEYVLTFGVQYSREPHPRMIGVDPDGWAVIIADTWADARRIAFDRLGPHWSGLYHPAEHKPWLFAHGEFARYDPAVVHGRTDDGQHPVCGACGTVGFGNTACPHCRWMWSPDRPLIPASPDSRATQ